MAKKQQQVNIYNDWKNSISVIYYYSVGDLVYVDKTVFYFEL